MDYAANQSKYASDAIGAKAQYANQGVLGGGASAAPPPTIASALGRVDGLNGRLREITAQLASISDAVGGPRPATATGNEKVTSNGIVYRLNDGADAAHRQLSEIEEIIGAIGRALG